MPTQKELNKDFFKKWSRDMAYVLGFFAADGSMIKNKRGGHFVEFEITDRELLYKIRKILGSNHKISTRKRVENHKRSYRLQVGSKEIFCDLKKLGMTPSKSNTLKFPRIPTRYFGDFVRGYFDGDGYVGLSKYWRKNRSNWNWQFSTAFISGSKDFLIGLKDSLKNNVSGGALSKKVEGGYELVFSKNDSLALFNLMYNNTATELFLRRKHRIFQEFISTNKMRA